MKRLYATIVVVLALLAPLFGPLAPVAAAQGCFADKIATVNEVSGAGAQRMELSTGDKLHVDYYPQRGAKSVSIIVHSWEFAVLMGFGSMWEFPQRDCASYDMIADATRYAQARGPRGHSGVVYGSLHNYIHNLAPAVNLFGNAAPRPVLGN